MNVIYLGPLTSGEIVDPHTGQSFRVSHGQAVVIPDHLVDAINQQDPGTLFPDAPSFSDPATAPDNKPQHSE